jgi:hypothetical protein
MKVSKNDPLRLSKSFLEDFFKEAVSKNKRLWPDEAMNKLIAKMGKLIETKTVDIDEARRENPRTDVSATNRELHHYAVDLFYKTYYERPTGAPPLSKEYLENIVLLRERDKLTFSKIAIKLEGTPKSADKIRKQYDIAKKKGIEFPLITSQEKN